MVIGDFTAGARLPMAQQSMERNTYLLIISEIKLPRPIATTTGTTIILYMESKERSVRPFGWVTRWEEADAQNSSLHGVENLSGRCLKMGYIISIYK